MNTFPPPPPRGEKESYRGAVLLIIAAALLVIITGAVLVYALHSTSSAPNTASTGTPGSTVTSTVNTSATGTALANAGANAQASATAQTQASATAQANASATASAQAAAQARANATATAVAANPYGGTLVLNDPLTGNSQGHQWNVTSNASVGTSCGFVGNAYHMVMPQNYAGACTAENTNFGNFAFQFQMTFSHVGQHFSGAGLVFRGAPGNQYYVLEIFESGQYTFFSCNGNNCSHGIAGYPASSLISSFHTGLSQTNTIAVVAKGSTFSFYANGQPFAQNITDATYTQGLIGFYAEGGSNPGDSVDVAFTNAKVWQL